jgi:threonylcarbamoyladenosine tRNA methylthiotransferase MtaB
MSTFHVENFGCRAARADGEAVSARLRALGLNESPFADAEIVLLNTCSVTAEADRDARAFVRKTRRANPAAKIVVTGCYAQRAPEEIAALPGVAAVVGNSHKALLPEILRDLAQAPVSPLLPAANLLMPVLADDRFAHSFLEEAPLAPGNIPGTQTRPNLKIQEGCGNRCTFCVIPTTRGHSRSLPADKVLAQIRQFVAAGGHELVLSGINLGRWGRDIAGSPTFSELLRRIVETTGLARLRLSSIEPMDWTAGLIALLRDCTPSTSEQTGRIARHAHLPLQSGSDSVLRRMHRRYRPWHYEQKVASLAEAIGPQLALGADVMIGFPGETDAEFRETHELIARLPLTYLHLFPFSPRPGTPGWDLHRQFPVPAAAVHERIAALRTLAGEKTLAFRRSLLGHSLPAITLHTPPETAALGRTLALTDNFLPVEIDASLPSNTLLSVLPSRLIENGIVLAQRDLPHANIPMAS